jgi:hypothetical protein
MAITKIGTTGISNNLDVPGYLYLSGDNKELRFYNGANYMILKASGSLSNNYTITLPVDDGTSGQFLKTDGGGVLSWDAAGGTTINTNADNRIITGSGTANTLNGESNLTFSTDLTITSGNVVIGTAGKGIDFSATANSSGTMTSELLDWYEEGTFTPTLQDDSGGGSVAYGVQTGRYTRVGNRVHCEVRVTTTGISGLTGGHTAKIAGLPFSQSSNAQAAITAGYADGLALGTAGDSVTGYMVSGQSYLLLQYWTVSSGVSPLTVANWSSNGALTFDITYEV